MCATNQALTFTDKEVGCCLRDNDSMLAVVNPFFGGPLKHILLGMPLCSIYGIVLGCSREVMVTKVTCFKICITRRSYLYYNVVNFITTKYGNDVINTYIRIYQGNV